MSKMALLNCGYFSFILCTTYKSLGATGLLVDTYSFNELVWIVSEVSIDLKKKFSVNAQ